MARQKRVTLPKYLCTFVRIATSAFVHSKKCRKDRDNLKVCLDDHDRFEGNPMNGQAWDNLKALTT